MRTSSSHFTILKFQPQITKLKNAIRVLLWPAKMPYLLFPSFYLGCFYSPGSIFIVLSAVPKVHSSCISYINNHVKANSRIKFYQCCNEWPNGDSMCCAPRPVLNVSNPKTSRWLELLYICPSQTCDVLHCLTLLKPKSLWSVEALVCLVWIMVQSAWPWLLLSVANFGVNFVISSPLQVAFDVQNPSMFDLNRQ